MKDKTNNKRKQILNAAQKCFLHYGYSKSSLKDVAKEARMSRASLYLYFKNKSDLFITMNQELHEGYEAKSGEILKSNQSNKVKLAKIIDAWIVDPYRVLKNTPYSNDLLDGLAYIAKRSEMRFRDLFMKSIAPLAGDGIAEIIVLAIRGLMDDRPPVRVLQKRIELLTKTLT